MKDTTKSLLYTLHIVDINNITYSLDNIRITFEADTKAFQALIDHVFIETQSRTIKEKKSANPCKYFYHYTISYGPDVTLTIGYSFNGGKSYQRERGYLEFNPNKLFHFPQFYKDFEAAKKHLNILGIKRYDVAIDIPIPRENIAMIRTGKKEYELIHKSHSNKTEYFGKRNHMGFIKLYNKSIEAGLQKPLTRFEITYDTESTVELPMLFDTTNLPPKIQAMVEALATNSYNDKEAKKLLKDIPTMCALFSNNPSPAIDALSVYKKKGLKVLVKDKLDCEIPISIVYINYIRNYAKHLID